MSASAQISTALLVYDETKETIVNAIILIYVMLPGVKRAFDVD
jgi:hypothetical protein